MTKLKKIIFCLMSVVLAFVFTEAQARYVVTEATPIVFHDKEVRVYEDPTNRASHEDVLKKLDLFVPANQVTRYKPSATYWIVQQIASGLDYDREIQIEASGWKDLTAYLLDSQGKVKKLKPVGFVGSSNPYLSGSPTATPILRFESQFPRFILRKGEELTVLSSVNFHPIFPAKSFYLNFIDSSTFAEFRRFSLYMEGLLLGILFSLTIFSIFNAVQSKDKVNVYYAIWITIAFLSVSSLSIIDGHRLFEFFVNIEGLKASWNDSYAYIISIGLAFAQSISYVLFARQYLDIKNYFPKIQFITNVWVAYTLVYCFLALTGGYYPEDSIFNAQSMAMVYSLSVGAILLTFFICSYIRYRAGFGFALFFTYAVVPYLVFRLGFLFGIIGLSSPFQYLPDQGFGYFLKNPWTNQAFGVCMEALIMALAVISRARWLQSELTLSAKKQTELIEQQNVVLEAKVEERTQELRIKHEVVTSSMNYASRLQRGQLPRAIRLEGRFSSFATVWEPRDTIGGDLYWVSSSQHQGSFILAVADCTGHGVPGAMLSLLVSNSLERIYANDTDQDPAAALLSLDHFVRSGLNQDRPDSESDDGCDAIVLRIDRARQTIEFAGAKLALFQVTQSGVLTRHKGARCSLGYQDAISAADKPVLQTIHYQPTDIFAIVTDGVTDQPGGETGKSSYGYRRLEAVLKAHCHQDANEITQAIVDDYTGWQGANARRDDVTVVVFRL